MRQRLSQLITKELNMMFDIMRRYEKRISRSRERLKAVWNRQNDLPVFIISDVNYALCGQHDIPEDYYEPAVMFEYQKNKIERHMRDIDDDYIPVFHPWYGTAVVPSALGINVRFQKGMDPSASGIALSDAVDIKKLCEPNYQNDGQFPDVLRCLKYFRENTDAPVCVTDTQGPLNIALTLAGPENLFVWMYEEKSLVHELMAFCTHVLIQWVNTQKTELGLSPSKGAYPHAIELPEGLGGVAFADDDAGIVSRALYEKFVVPYNEKLLDAFKGGTMHFCGSAHQQLSSITGMKGLVGVNNFCMSDFEQIRDLNILMEGKGAVMACDFNAADPAAYCAGFKRVVGDIRGIVNGIFRAPGMQLEENSYVYGSKNRDEAVEQYLYEFNNWQER